jgi:hypothetical protein
MVDLHTVDHLRLAAALALSVPAAEAVAQSWRWTTTRRHALAAASGLLLVLFCHGTNAVHAFPPMVLVHLGMTRAPRHADAIAWCVCMPYLVALHAASAGGAASDFTGCAMILTLKLVSVACAVRDGLSVPPAPLQLASYVFAFGNLLVGPWMCHIDYAAFIDNRETWREGPPPGRERRLRAARCAIEALFHMVMHLACSDTWNAATLESEWYARSAWWLKLAACTACGVATLFKYACAWKLSEAALSCAGLNVDGRYENVRLGMALTSDNAREVVRHWNVQTGVFLRRYVYDRLPRDASSATRLVLTQLVAALWHGFHVCHFMMFGASALWLETSTTLYRVGALLDRRAPRALSRSRALKRALYAVRCVWTIVSISHVASAFLTLDVQTAIAVWYSVGFLPEALMVVGAVLKPFVPRQAP